MIVVGILLVALLVISDGATVRKEFVISDCNCDDNSEVFDTTQLASLVPRPLFPFLLFPPPQIKTEKAVWEQD